MEVIKITNELPPCIKKKSPRALSRWKKRQAEKERKRLERERLEEIDSRLHDWGNDP